MYSTMYTPSMKIIPLPRSIEKLGGSIGPFKGIILVIKSDVLKPILHVLKKDLKNLADIQVMDENLINPGDLIGVNTTTISLEIKDGFKEEEHEITIDKDISIEGGSYKAVTQGLSTIYQVIKNVSENGASFPRVKIKDSPFASYRGLLVDLARKKHKMKTLYKIVDMCRWYKLNHLHLHLTDKPAFTFPSKKYPMLPTKGHHFKWEELVDLERYATERGITIMPEMDVPGHARSMIKAMPETFKLNGEISNDVTINMGKEKVYEVIDDLIGELCEVFTSTPWIHLGADEVPFKGIDTDPDCHKYMKDGEIKSVEELYRHFITRLNEMVRKHGKTLCIWEGFRPEGEIEIPKDIIVFEFESLYNLADNLAREGYTLVNTSWLPLYVTPFRHWTAEEIFKWNMFQWRNWTKSSPATKKPIQLKTDARVLGAQVCSWEQKDKPEITSLRRRIAAMVERTWSVVKENADQAPSEEEVTNFLERLEFLDAKLDKLLKNS
ncbi:MAG: family 20 glycosylhydrolase [Candidatus Hodarchaeota archaeon]